MIRWKTVLLTVIMLFAAMPLPASEPAPSIEVGVAWQGKSIMPERVLAGVRKVLEERAPQITLDIRRELKNMRALEDAIVDFERTKHAMIILRSSGAALLGRRDTAIPTFIGGVNNPVELGVAESLAKPKPNITGVTYYLPAHMRLEYFRQLFPEMKKLLLLVEDSHPGTSVDINETNAAARQLGMELRVAYCRTIDDLRDAVGAALEDEVLLLGVQALIMDNVSAITSLAGDRLIFSYSWHAVEQGALAGIAADDEKLGRMLALMLIDHVIHGKPIAEMPIQIDPEPFIRFNYAALERHRDRIPLAYYQMAKSQQMLESILKSAPTGIGVVKNRIIVQVNDYILNLTGYTREELIGQNAGMLYPTREESDYVGMEKYRQIAERGTGSVETRWLRKDGGIRHVILSSTPLNPSEPGAGVTFTVLDITDRKTAEKNLQESEARFRNLFDNHTAVMLLIDPKSGVIIDVNPSAVAYYGWPRDKLTGMHIQNINTLSPGEIEREMQNAKSHSRTHFEFRHQRADGSIRDVAVFSSGVHIGPEVVLFSIIHDITDRKKAEAALSSRTRLFLIGLGSFAIVLLALVAKLMVSLRQRRHAEKTLVQSEEKFRFLVDHSYDLIWLLNSDGVFSFVSPSWKSILGYDPSYLEGKAFKLFVHPDDFAECEKYIRTVLDAQKAMPGPQYRVKHADGNWRWHEGSITPVFADDGSFIYFVGVSRDITERKRAEEEKEKLQAQLLQAQKMESVGRLAGGIAHDFNNMLGVILGHVEFALERAEGNHRLLSDMKEIQTAAQRSADLTKQLLAFARRQTIAPRELDLNDTVESILNMLRRLIGEDIDLIWKPAAQIWSVKMDPSQIDQILANLCVNARDAITGVGKLTIETGKTSFDQHYCNEHLGFRPGDFVLLAVSDNGCGMDKNDMDNLFEPFFTTKDVGKGTGLGLATVYGIVKQNNGFINVYSEPGHGSTFKIYLPRFVADDAAAMDIPEKKTESGGNETILLVEDEPAVLSMTRLMLERKGYTVLSAATPNRALEKAKNYPGPIDLLMTDVVMPEMNGRDLARRITALYPDIKLLFMSGYTANVIAHHAVLDKGVAFIQKPFSVAEIAAKLREVLEHFNLNKVD